MDSSSQLNQKEKMDIMMITISNLKELYHIDKHKTSKLIIQSFSDQHKIILHKLHIYPELQYLYLNSIMESSFPIENLKNKNNSFLLDSPKLLKKEKNDNDEDDINSPFLQELYIKLMCIYDKSHVYEYLISHDNYPLDSCLTLCKNAEIIDATIYLLERTGDINQALQLLLQVLIILSKLKKNFYFRYLKQN